MTRRQVLMLASLALLWGASFMFIKVCVRELEPTLLVCLRLGIGAVALLPLAVARLGARRFLREFRSAWTSLVLIGAVNSAVPITALSWAEQRLDSGLAAVIQASAPLFTALLALRFSRSEIVTGPRLLGLLVGFGGVALLVGVQPSGTVGAALAVTFSALCYAIAALASARLLPGLSPLVSATGALAAGTLLLVPFAASQAPSHFPSREIVGALLALGIGGTSVGYALYYALLTSAGASRSILITYLVPAIALVYGAVFLGERVTVAAVGGLALVLVGVALGTGVVKLARRKTQVTQVGG